MSRLTRTLVIGAMLAAMHLAGMTAVAHAQATDQPTGSQATLRPPTERQVGESWRHRQAASPRQTATLSAGQALAGPDERVLERQGRIDRQAANGEAGDQGRAAEPSRVPSAQSPRRYLPPEPPVYTGPRLDAGQQVPPTPAPSVPADSRTGLAVTLAVAALLLAAGSAATWRIHRRRPRPGLTT